MIIDTYFDGTKHMHDFGREVMIPQLKALLGPTAQESALCDIYFKMHLFLGSAITMNRLNHFQSVAALTRSLFELFLDMKMLAADKIGDAVKRYNEFPEIERYRRAEQLIAFDTKHPGGIKQDLTVQRGFVSDPARQARVMNEIGPKRKYPDHWSGMNARGPRAQRRTRGPVRGGVCAPQLVCARGSRRNRRHGQGRAGIGVRRLPRPHSADFPGGNRGMREGDQDFRVS